jgi:NTE family protein
VNFFDSQAQQKVGLVLSGGGATGFAHIGVIQALEEKGIPIDYITGTSAGALIGGLYAAGYSPQEIKDFVLSEDFILMSSGSLRSNQQFLTKKEDENASMVKVPISQDSILQKSFPTNFTNSTFLDFELMKLLAPASLACNNQFDQLFVPFRCLASDIVAKKNIVFKQGNLNEVIRASMTYPFYFQPLRIDGKLLFDGGLYNNFPADVLYEEFSPDYIIGSNVSVNASKPDEDDLISQITNMLVRYSDFSLPCENGIIIEPKLSLGTFEFDRVEEAIQSGYEAGLLYADSIQLVIDRRVDPEDLKIKRILFRAEITPITISGITTNASKREEYFIQKSLLRNRKTKSISEEDIEKRYYRLAATEHIEFLFPTLSIKDTLGYTMDLKIRKANEFRLDVGGHISSRPVNTGYVGLTYMRLKKAAYKLHASSYFGKFYGSVHTDLKIEIPALFPLTIEPYYTRNRWDYFKSFATFFEDEKPSFLLQNESYYGLKISHPLSNTMKSSYDFRMVQLDDNYYQSDNFTASDTSDHTRFEGFTIFNLIEQNSLNRKQFASSGTLLRIKSRYVNGTETSIGGSTSINKDTLTKNHQWINLNFDFQSFLIDNSFFHFGIQGKATFNSQSLLTNYTASLLTMTTFNILPDVETYFFEEYRSPLFFGGGINTIFTIKKSIDLRFDGFFYQPLAQLVKNDDGSFGYSKPFKGESFIASASLIYHSILGPLRFTTNYFPKQTNPLAIQFSFGYVLFNERAIR